MRCPDSERNGSFDLSCFYDDEVRRWGDSARTSQYVSARNFRLLQRNVVRWLGPPRGQKILDAGCGTGLFDAPLLKRNEVFGVDFSEQSLHFAARRGLRVVCGEVGSLPFQENAFDITLCIGVLQHLTDTAPILRELARVTRPGGVVLCSTINRPSVQRFFLSMLWHPPVAEQLRAYTMDELGADFQACRLGEIEFLNLYYPLSITTRRQRGGMLQNYFSSTLVIRGRKPL